MSKKNNKKKGQRNKLPQEQTRRQPEQSPPQPQPQPLHEQPQEPEQPPDPKDLKKLKWVRDEDLKGLVIDVPDEQSLNRLNFPTPNVEIPADNFFEEMASGSEEWGVCWFELLEGLGLISFGDFSRFSVEEKEELKGKLVEMVRKKRRALMYNKWQAIQLVPRMKDIIKERIKKWKKEKRIAAKRRKYLREWQWNVNWDEGEDEDEENEEEEDLIGLIYDDYNVKGSYACDVDGFPQFHRDDRIKCYKGPLSLTCWYSQHMPKTFRWSPVYERWGGSKLRLETMAVIQSIISAVIDYLDTHGAHPNLAMDRFILFQSVECYSGVKKVKFTTTILADNRGSSSSNISVEATMARFIEILKILLHGGKLDSELRRMMIFLQEYPFSNGTHWKRDVLKSFPGLWNATERSSFLVNFYFQYVNDLPSTGCLQAVYDDVIANQSVYFKLGAWKSEVPQGSILHMILLEQIKRGGEFREGDISEVVRFARISFHPYREKPGASQLDVRRVDMLLSKVFDELVLSLFVGMCRTNNFLG